MWSVAVAAAAVRAGEVRAVTGQLALVQLSPPAVQHARIGTAQRIGLARSFDLQEAPSVGSVNHAHLKSEAHIDLAAVGRRLSFLERQLTIGEELKRELLPLAASPHLHVHLRAQQHSDVFAE